MQDTLEDEIHEPTEDERRRGLYYLLGAVALMLIPIITGIVLANTGGEGNEESSGMAPSDTADVGTTAAAPDRVNLALEATVIETSSDFNETFVGANAIDGSIATEWSSRGDGDDAYIVIDLGSSKDITGIGFRTREMTDGSAITDSFTVTIDGGETLGPFDAGVGFVTADFAATGREIRIDLVATTGGNTGAIEIEIYGS
jgi:hypothetical protein